MSDKSAELSHSDFEDRLEHLNAVLRAIRNINQLITHETDRGRLLQGACNSLVETRGYNNAWIALRDETGKLVSMTAASLNLSRVGCLYVLTRRCQRRTSSLSKIRHQSV